MSNVCAYSSVQLDTSRVETEFTHISSVRRRHLLVFKLGRLTHKQSIRTLRVSNPYPGPDLLLAGPCSEKMWEPLLYEYPLPDCLRPTRTVVIIDILLRTRAAMHTTIAAAAVWQFETTQNRFLYSLIIISIFLVCYHVAKKWKKLCFCGAPFLWGGGGLFGRTCWTCLNPPLSLP